MKPLIRILVVVMLLAPVLARGQEADLLRPFVDAQTTVIARVDFSRLDIPQLRAWLLESVRTGGGDVKNAEAVIDELAVPAQQWIKSFTAAGGSRIYLLADTSFTEPTIVVPLSKDADAAVLKRMILPERDGFATTQRDALLVRARPARLKQMAEPAARPEIAAAFASAGDSAVAVVLVPSADARKVLEQLLPVLPQELGGKPIGMLLSGLSHGTWTLDSRPKMATRVFLQMADPASAANAAAALTAMIDAAGKNPHLAALMALLKPVTTENRVDLPLDTAMPKLAIALVDAAMHARGTARMTASMSNARQIVMACHIYTAENKNEFPASLDQLKPYLKEPQIFTLPHRPGAAWVYLRPPPLNKIANADSQIVLHEPADPWPAAGVVAAFADGHVEVMNDQKRFDDLLQKTVAANKAK